MSSDTRIIDFAKKCVGGHTVPIKQVELAQALLIAVEALENLGSGGRHYNKTPNGEENCQECGRNFRDPIHWRQGENPTGVTMESQAKEALSKISSL